MRIEGTLVRDGIEYFLYMTQNRYRITYILASPYHRDDLYRTSLGEIPKHPVLTAEILSNKGLTGEYIVSSIKSEPKVGYLAYGQTAELESIINFIQSALTRSYKSSDIEVDARNDTGSHVFEAYDGTIHIAYSKQYEGYNYLKIIAEDFHMELYEDTLKLSRKLGIAYEPYNMNMSSKRSYFEINQVTYEELCSLYDLEWQKQMNFITVDVIKKFEEEFIVNLVNAYKAAVDKGEKFYIVNDIETNGLNVFDMPSHLQSTICAVSIAWSGTTSYLIYLDMEHHSNVPMEYFRERINDWFKFDFTDDSKNIFTFKYLGGEIEINRNQVEWINTNTMFDQRGYMTAGMDIFYNYDVETLVFALSPFHTKGNKSLKKLEDKFLGFKAISLKETLGAGNEGNFRYIKDKRVAEAYACPDSCNLYTIFFKLRDLYGKCAGFFKKDLWKTIQSQYPLIQYIIAVGDYYGSRVDRDGFLREARAVKGRKDQLEKFARKFIGYQLDLIKYKKVVEKGQTLGIDISSYPKPTIESSQPYTGVLANDSLRHILYEEMRYPKIAYTKPSKNSKTKKEHVPKVSLSKSTMQSLADYKRGTEIVILNEDLMYIDKETGEEHVVLEAKEINRTVYPVAYMLTLIGPLKKEYDSYFAPFEELLKYSDRIFKGSRVTNIDTYRISNMLQIVKASLKKNFKPFSDDHIIVNWDKSQIELRVAAALADFPEMKDILNVPEYDIHRERAAVAYFTKPHLITKEQRHDFKTGVFGDIYGQSVFGLCYNLFNNLNDDSLEKAKLINKATKASLGPVYEALDKIRDEALIPRKLPKELAEFLDINPETPVGVCFAETGCYKLFELDNMDKDKEKRIRNQIGNFPIQHFAAYIFKNSIINLFKFCWEKEWWQDKIYMFHLTVHDELNGSWNYKKKSVYEAIHAIVSSCVYKLPGHPSYFVGINFAENWYNCKIGLDEMPIRLALDIKQKVDKGELDLTPTDDPLGLIRRENMAYFLKFTTDYLFNLYPKFKDGLLDSKKVVDLFTSYTVRGYLADLATPLWKTEKDNDFEKLEALLCGFYLQYIGDTIKIKRPRGTVHVLTQEHAAKAKFKPSFSELCELSYEQLSKARDNVLDDITFETGERTDLDDADFYRNMNWSFDSTYDDSTDWGEGEDEDKRLQKALEKAYEKDENNKITSIRKQSKAEYEHLFLTGDTVHLNTNSYTLAPIFDRLKSMDAALTYSDKRVKTIIHNSSQTKIMMGPEIESSLLHTIDEMIERKEF